MLVLVPFLVRHLGMCHCLLFVSSSCEITCSVQCCQPASTPSQASKPSYFFHLDVSTNYNPSRKQARVFGCIPCSHSQHRLPTNPAPFPWITSRLQPPQCIVLVSGTVSSRPPVQGMVLLAVPPKHHRALVSRLDLSNKIVIDVSNPSPAKPGWMRLTRRTGRATGPAQAASNSSQRSDTCISAAERLQLMLNLQHNSKLTGVADDASVPAQHRAGSSSGSVGTDGGGVSNSANSAGFPPTVVLSLAPDFVGQLDPGQAAQTSLEPPCPGRLTQAAPPGKTASAAVYNLQPFSKPTPATVVKAFNGLSAIDLGNQVRLRHARCQMRTLSLRTSLLEMRPNASRPLPLRSTTLAQARLALCKPVSRPLCPQHRTVQAPAQHTRRVHTIPPTTMTYQASPALSLNARLHTTTVLCTPLATAR